MFNQIESCLTEHPFLHINLPSWRGEEKKEHQPTDEQTNKFIFNANHGNLKRPSSLSHPTKVKHITECVP